jgi:4-hydroxybenzoate polyprenyltransferase
VKNAWAYLQERFPPQVNGPLIISYFSANYLLARGSVWPNQPIQLSWSFPAGCIALLLMFFHMRVVDEHIDYERDRIVHPGRALSRGLVTLKQLRYAGWIAIAAELILSYFLGIPAFMVCLALLGLTWLIYHEFYAGAALGRHLLANAFLHLIVMPVYSLYVFSAATRRFPWSAPTAALLYAWVSYGVGLAYELARKTRAPEDERPGLITYSSVMGPYAPATGALLALLFSGALSLGVGLLLHFEIWFHATVAVLLLIVAGGVLRFRLRTTPATAAHLQIYAGLFIFAFDLLTATELIRLHGLAWA